MDWNRVEGNWKHMKGKVKEKWGKLTDDDLDVINGRREQLEGKIQERYGYAKDQARKRIVKPRIGFATPTGRAPTPRAHSARAGASSIPRAELPTVARSQDIVSAGRPHA